MNQRFIIIGVIALVVIGLGVGGWLYLSPKQQGVDSEQPKQEGEVSESEPVKELSTVEKITARSFAEKVLKLLQGRDYGKIYDLLTEEDKAKISRANYIRQRVEEEDGATITEWEVKEVLEEEDGASVQYVIKIDSPVLGYITTSQFLTLVKRDGKWFLSLGASKIIIEKGVGDEIELATLKFRVNKVEEKQVLTQKYRVPTEAKEGAKFIVIDMDITNITNVSFTLPDNSFIIIDDKGREFVKTISSIDNYLNYRELAPSIKENGVLVYEIPKDAMSYSLMIGKAGTNEAYKVILR